MSKTGELDSYQRKLFDLLCKDALRKETVVLSSGKKSSYYIDARAVTLNPKGAFYAASIILSKLSRLDIKAIGGPTIGADPIVGAIATLSFLKKIPLKTFIVRKSVKTHGKRKQIEGPFIEPGSSVAIVDDVATTGSSLVEAVKILQRCGLIVKEAIVIVDREEGAKDNLKNLNVSLSSLFKASDFL